MLVSKLKQDSQSQIKNLEYIQNMLYGKSDGNTDDNFEESNITFWRIAHLKQFADYIKKQGISKNWTYREEKEPGQEVNFDHVDGSEAGFEFDLNFVYTEDNGDNVVIIHKPLYSKPYIESVIYDVKLPTKEVLLFDSFNEIIEYMKSH